MKYIDNVATRHDVWNKCVEEINSELCYLFLTYFFGHFVNAFDRVDFKQMDANVESVEMGVFVFYEKHKCLLAVHD